MYVYCMLYVCMFIIDEIVYVGSTFASNFATYLLCNFLLLFLRYLKVVWKRSLFSDKTACCQHLFFNKLLCLLDSCFEVCNKEYLYCIV
jgi:hypothetical protein